MDSSSHIRVVEAKHLAIAEIAAVMSEGRPWLPDSSDYWFFATFCGSTSFVALKETTAVGGLIACRDAQKLDQIYIDQVAVRRQSRGQGIVQALFLAVEARARELYCTRLVVEYRSKESGSASLAATRVCQSSRRCDGRGSVDSSGLQGPGSAQSHLREAAVRIDEFESKTRSASAGGHD